MNRMDGKNLPWDENDNLINSEGYEDDPIAEEYYPKIKPGEYNAFCYKVDLGCYKDQRKIYIRFKLIENPYEGYELFMACNYPKGTIRPVRKYYKQWMIANQRPPKQGERLARSIFKGKKFKILVADTQRKLDNDKFMSTNFQYSIVKSIIEVLKEE